MTLIIFIVISSLENYNVYGDWKTAGVQPAYKNRGEIDCENNFRYVGHGPYWKKNKDGTKFSYHSLSRSS